MRGQHQNLVIRRTARRGTVVLQFAFVLPLFLMLVWGTIEFGRMVLVADTLIAAAQEGARAGIIPGSNSNTAKAAANSVLTNTLISGATVTTTPTEISTLDAGDSFTVNASIPFANVSWLPMPFFIKNKVIKASCSMLREGK